jgi:crotonobetainyl-CoA:carnitine CoA-transferase CaiB-like acyl-CoA transferase
MKQGLDGVTVLEIGTTVVAPYTTQALGALGAEVIKIEKPGGDPFRQASLQTEAGISGYFAMCNMGKESLTLDLKKEEGRELFLDLAEQSDVIVENLRAGTVDRLGVGYDDVREVNEDIVYCSISGYGQDGPWSHLPGFDPVLQGATGLMAITGEEDGDPVRIGVAVIDLMTATWSVMAIQNALLHRATTGDGTHIDMSMFDVGLSMLTKKASQYLITGENPKRMGTEDEWAAPYGAYTTKDERKIIIGTPFQELWERLCREIDREDLLEDERFVSNEERARHRDALNAELRPVFKERTLEEWLERLREKIPCGPVLSVEEALNNKQAEHSDVLNHFEEGFDVLNLPFRFDGDRHQFETPPPTPGGDSEAVLSDAGLSEAEIQELRQQGVI